MNYMPPHILEPVNGLAHTNTFILLHGRSSTAEEFASDFFSLTTSKAGTNLRSRFPTWRWVFPDAGMRWCTSFQNKRSAWFDTFSLEDLREKEALQIEGLRDGVHLVREIVEAEVGRLGGHAEKVVLGGFSQGSAVALWSVFTGAAMTKGTLGAFVGLSAWMPFTKEAKEAVVQTADPSTMRIGKLATVFADILGIGPFMQVEAMQERLQMPVYLGHGIDVGDAILLDNDEKADSFFSRTLLSA